MNIFTLESYMDDDMFLSTSDSYMTEGLKEIAGGVKDFIAKIIKMIGDFIQSIIDKFREFMVKRDIKKKLADLRKIPSKLFGNDTVEVPDIKSHKAIMKNITDGADKALDALASRNPFYIRSYEAGSSDDTPVKTKKMRRGEAINYLDTNSEKEIHQVNQYVDAETRRLCSKMEKVVEKNPDAAPKAKGIISRVVGHFKKHAGLYVTYVLSVATFCLAFNAKELHKQNKSLSNALDKANDENQELTDKLFGDWKPWESWE